MKEHKEKANKMIENIIEIIENDPEKLEPYGIGMETVFSLVLAGGGPSCNLELRHDSYKRLIDAELVYNNWFEEEIRKQLSSKSMKKLESVFSFDYLNSCQ